LSLAEYLVCLQGATAIDLPIVLEKLATRFQIKTLILEGGGKINGTKLRAGDRRTELACGANC
jgi:riboflavin biosynthesis pyrimidine reductase